MDMHECVRSGNRAESCLSCGRMGGRPLNVAFAEPKQIEQQQQPAQPKVSMRHLQDTRVSLWDCTYAEVVLESHWEPVCKTSELPSCAAHVQVIYVGNLPNTATETNLKELFDTFSGGEVCSLPCLTHAELDASWLNLP